MTIYFQDVSSDTNFVFFFINLVKLKTVWLKIILEFSLFWTDSSKIYTKIPLHIDKSHQLIWHLIVATIASSDATHKNHQLASHASLEVDKYTK